MFILTRLFLALQGVSLCLMLFAVPGWAQQVAEDPEDAVALTSQDVADETDDGGQSFERELIDIEAQYSQLIPDHAKSTTEKEAPNDVDVVEDEESEAPDNE